MSSIGKGGEIVSANPDPIIGVILAAGRGTRMGQLSTRLPKAVLPILDEPIAYHQLRTMARLGIRRAYIVVAHRGFEVVREIQRMPDLGIEIDYVDQKETLGIAHCVGTLEPLLSGPFMLFLGDIYFDAPRMGEMVECFASKKADAVLGAVREEDEGAIRKNFCIVTDDDGKAVRVIEKPRHPKSRLKGVGVYLFSPVVFDAIRRTPRTAMRDEYEITDSIQILIDDGYHVWPSTCVEADLNVTYPRDLLDINLRVMRERGLDRFVAQKAVIGEGARIEDAVVGSGAKIGAGALVRHSVVFAGVEVPEGKELEAVVVTDAGVHFV
jgi:dTDP-glucose pyrophosphorylase